MLILIRAVWEGFRGSLFFVPLLFLLASIGLAVGTLSVDVFLRDRGIDPPLLLTSTVESARTLLATIAGATITVAGIAFSAALIMIQLASSQFSPRALREFFRDGFTKRTLGVVVGTFAYCLIVLRTVRGPVEGGQAIIPTVSVFVGLTLGLIAVLAIVGFINHSAHSMDAAEVIRRITDETRRHIAKLLPTPEARLDQPPSNGGPDPPSGVPTLVVRAAVDGWVQQIDPDHLLRAAGNGGGIRLETRPGDFLWEGAPLCTVWPRPAEEEHAVREAREAIRLGRTRTMQQDLGFGIRQLVDIALRALSPSTNDPSTAQEAIVHLGAILRDLLLRPSPPVHRVDERGRRLYRPREHGHDEFVRLAFDQIRRAGASQPAVMLTVIRVLGNLLAAVEDAERGERAPALRHEARLLLREVEAAGLLETDVEEIRMRATTDGLIGPRPAGPTPDLPLAPKGRSGED